MGMAPVKLFDISRSCFDMQAYAYRVFYSFWDHINMDKIADDKDV